MNNIAIQLKSTSTKFNFNSLQLHNWIKIQLKTNGMQIGKYSKSSFEYGVGKEKLKKNTNPKIHHSMRLHLGMDQTITSLELSNPQ